jgi:hypothetical protein
VKSDDFGIEAISKEDLSYKGLRFSEMHARCSLRKSLSRDLGREREPPLAFRKPTLSSLLRGLLPLWQAPHLPPSLRARWSTRTRTWARRQRLPPPHSSEWLLLDRIAGDHGRKTLISGYFRSRSRALIIGRFSTGAETRRGQMRAMALAGKLFPAIPVTPGGCAQPISLRWMISAAGPPAKPMMPSSAAAQT